MKLILAGVVLLAAVGLFFYFGRSSEPLPGTVQFVCVATGKTYALARDQIPSVLPAKNPKTGTLTLVPCEKKDGKVVMVPRYRDLLRDPEVEKANKYVDPQTLEVLASPRP